MGKGEDKKNSVESSYGKQYVYQPISTGIKKLDKQGFFENMLLLSTCMRETDFTAQEYLCPLPPFRQSANEYQKPVSAVLNTRMKNCGEPEECIYLSNQYCFTGLQF